MGNTTSPVNTTFGVGRDISVIVITPTGVQLDLTGQIEFSHKPMVTSVCSCAQRSPRL